MKSRSYIKNINSSSVWVYQAIEDSDERPRLVTFNNTGSVAIYVKWMNVNEGNGNASDKFYLAPGTSKAIAMESSELPLTRVAGLLFAGSTAASLVISTANFEPEA